MSSISSWKPPEKKPRSKISMRGYLSEHPRYHTMSSVNRSHSYARGIKLQWLSFPDKATEDTAWDLLGCNTDWWADSGASMLLDEFARRWNWSWQIGSNGRSGGYLVLYQGGCKDSQHRSYCTQCGQRNFCRVETPPAADAPPEEKFQAYWLTNHRWVPSVYPNQSEVAALGLPPERVIQLVTELQKRFGVERGSSGPWVTLHNVCGRCNQPARVNYAKPPVEHFSYPGKGTDEEQDYEDWDRSTLQQRVEVVWDFDQTVDQVIGTFINYCQNVRVEEEEILVSKTVRVAVPLNADDDT